MLNYTSTEAGKRSKGRHFSRIWFIYYQKRARMCHIRIIRYSGFCVCVWYFGDHITTDCIMYNATYSIFRFFSFSYRNHSKFTRENEQARQSHWGNALFSFPRHSYEKGFKGGAMPYWRRWDERTPANQELNCGEVYKIRWIFVAAFFLSWLSSRHLSGKNEIETHLFRTPQQHASWLAAMKLSFRVQFRRNTTWPYLGGKTFEGEGS